MNFTEKQITELTEYLQGSCKSLHEGVVDILGEQYSEDDLSQSNTRQIDIEIFNCATCGWWFEVYDKSESSDEDVCIECYEE